MKDIILVQIELGPIVNAIAAVILCLVLGPEWPNVGYVVVAAVAVDGLALQVVVVEFSVTANAAFDTYNDIRGSMSSNDHLEITLKSLSH